MKSGLAVVMRQFLGHDRVSKFSILPDASLMSVSSYIKIAIAVNPVALVLVDYLEKSMKRRALESINVLIKTI